MESGSTAANGQGEAHANGQRGAPNANGSANGHGQLPLTARLLVAGARGARSVGRATGIDRAVEVAAEEAIVAAVESEAVERALARVMSGPAVREAVESALGSEAVKEAVLEAMDSELVDEVWQRMLASDEAQQLVERIAEAPELRAAISAQGVGLLGDIGRTIADLARRLDGVVEGILRRLFLRRRRERPTDRAGLVSRGLAMIIDIAIVNFGFSAAAALVALIGSAFSGQADGLSGVALLAGFSVWTVVGSAYLLVFWSLAGQTPGMRFLGIRLADGRLKPRRSLARLFGLWLVVPTFGLALLGVVFGERRRGLLDRLGRTEVVYDERRPEPAPWSRLPAADVS